MMKQTSGLFHGRQIFCNLTLSRPEIGLHKKRVNNGKETGIKRGNNNGVFNC